MSNYRDCESRGDCDEAYRERDELKHDIERHIAICAQQQTRIAELEALLTEADTVLVGYNHLRNMLDEAISLGDDGKVIYDFIGKLRARQTPESK